MSSRRIIKIFKYIKNPSLLIKRWKMNKLRKISDDLDDEEFISRAFRIRCGYELNLENPATYNEKLQWLKLFDKNPLYHKLADKYLVREYVAERIGEKYLIPLLGYWDNPKDIDFTKLPSQFVIKCNHNSGLGMIICKDKNSLDFNKAREQISNGFREDYFKVGREWAYKDIQKKIVCEKYMKSTNSDDLPDYKFFCCDGKFKFLLVCTNRHTHLNNDWFDEGLHHLPCINGPKNNRDGIVLPENIQEMIILAEKLSQGIPHIRIDLYNVDNSIFFGEMTFYESSGFAPFKPKEYDLLFGSYIKLPQKRL